MDATLQKHHAKHVYKVPEGLRELCTDISREVLRSQPENLIAFIAEYVDTLLITRENTKSTFLLAEASSSNAKCSHKELCLAVKVVNNILLGSQAILCILYQSGFTLEQITVAAPKIQKAFQEYLDAVDTRPVQICEDTTCDEQSMISIRSILEATGATREDAERAATVIQAAFRGHYERMVLNEAHGKVQWQRAVVNTLDILRKAGATQAEISKAARHVKFAYRGYYTRRNRRIDAPEAEEEPLKKDERILEPAEAIQAVAWMEMMYEDSGLTLEKANEAATVIQRAYKKYRTRRRCYDVQQLETTKSMVAEAVLDEVRHKIFEKVTSRKDIPEEYGTREEMMVASTKLQVAFKEHLKVSHIVEEDAETVEEEEKDEGIEKVEPMEPPSKPKYRPVELTEEESTEEEEEEEEEEEGEEEGEEDEEEEVEELQVSEIEVTTATSPELLSEPEVDQRLTDAELDEKAEKADQEEGEEEEKEGKDEEQEELKEETKEDEKKEQKKVETEEEEEEEHKTEGGPSDVEEIGDTAHHAAE
ncbi:unnamed protein product [Xylocopa violacea]|uniref:RIIa domain-containing protein n=1 Tax=Xylocopa violacea TaxID=135666 RepID=A0ABP1NUU9_XYLVO